MARIGKLVVQSGRWEGRQVISEAWITLSTSRQTEMDEENARAGFDYGFVDDEGSHTGERREPQQEDSNEVEGHGEPGAEQSRHDAGGDDEPRRPVHGAVEHDSGGVPDGETREADDHLQESVAEKADQEPDRNGDDGSDAARVWPRSLLHVYIPDAPARG